MSSLFLGPRFPVPVPPVVWPLGTSICTRSDASIPHFLLHSFPLRDDTLVATCPHCMMVFLAAFNALFADFAFALSDCLYFIKSGHCSLNFLFAPLKSGVFFFATYFAYKLFLWFRYSSAILLRAHSLTFALFSSPPGLGVIPSASNSSYYGGSMKCAMSFCQRSSLASSVT